MKFEKVDKANFEKWVDSTYKIYEIDGGEICISPDRYPLVYLYEFGYIRIVEFNETETNFVDNDALEQYLKENKNVFKEQIMMLIL